MKILAQTSNDNYCPNIDNKLLHFFNLLYDANNYATSKLKKCFTSNITKINNINEIPKSSMDDKQFFPNEIQLYINNKSLYKFYFSCKIKKRILNIYFILFNKPDVNLLIINKQIKMICMWIFILSKYSSIKCSKQINMFVYFTPFIKKLPNNRLMPINTINVNTGFTTGCKELTEIVLYRNEEWFKVFIHETFHNFGLDFSDMNLYTINTKLKGIFNVNIEYNLYESYCETWARIWNTIFYSYFTLSHVINPDQSYFIS